MSAGKRSAAISEAVTTRSTRQPLSTTRQKTRSRQVPPENTQKDARTVYFNVCVYDTSDLDEPEPVEELQAGKTYLLAIICEDHPSSINKKLQQDGQPVAGAFSLTLSYSYDISVTTPITPSKQSFPFQAIFPDQYTYEFTLPSDFPPCNVTITVNLKTQQRPWPLNVVRYTLAVCGQKKPQELEIFHVSQINQRLPEKTAILLVETAIWQTMHKQQVRLRGWSEAGQQLDEPASMSVIISIERLQEYRKKQKMQTLGPDEILNRLTYFSRHSPPSLLRWLHTLFLAYQEPFNLIIVDLTDREIPWELVEMKRGLYLGACARVVRWLPPQYFEVTRNLFVQPNYHEGPVISYLDTHLGPDLIQNEQDALQLLAGRACSSLSDLRKRLEDSLEDVGMIYIGCHGWAGQHLLQQNVPELSSIMLEGLYECKPPRLTIFMNACESARTIKKSLDDQSNFVDTFLGYCASGFIGPLAQVDIATASLIARQMLLAALQPDGVQIAEQLRILRNNVVKQLQELERNATASQDDYYRMIDTFMYVYYGNPLARLQLYQRKEPGQ